MSYVYNVVLAVALLISMSARWSAELPLVPPASPATTTAPALPKEAGAGLAAPGAATRLSPTFGGHAWNRGPLPPLYAVIFGTPCSAWNVSPELGVSLQPGLLVALGAHLATGQQRLAVLAPLGTFAATLVLAAPLACTQSAATKVAQRGKLLLPRPRRIEVEVLTRVRVRFLDTHRSVNIGSGHVTTYPFGRPPCLGWD